MLNSFEEKHQEYRRLLQNIIVQLKDNNTNIQTDLLDLEWSIKNDLYRLDVLGQDAFEDEYEELMKFVPVIDAIKQKYGFNYSIEESSFDDFEEDDEDDTDNLEVVEDVDIIFNDDELLLEDEVEEEIQFEGELVEGELEDLFPFEEDEEIKDQ